MFADVDLAALGALLGDKARSAILLALLGGQPLSATALADRAGISRSLASAHLNRLRQGSLVVAERHGRHRCYQLADPEVARALESLAAIAPPGRVRSLRDATVRAALRHARMCSDHLAGALGVALTDALLASRMIRPSGDTYAVVRVAEDRWVEFGIDIAVLRKDHRALARQCMDWSERRPHVAGALGAAVAAHCFDLGWLERVPSSRAVRVTGRGEVGLEDVFGLAPAVLVRQPDYVGGRLDSKSVS